MNMQVEATNSNPPFEIKSGPLQITLKDNKLTINHDKTTILHKPIDEIKNSNEPEDLRLQKLLTMIDKAIRAAQRTGTPHLELKEFLEKEGEPIQLLDALISQMSTAERREDLIPDKDNEVVKSLFRQIKGIDFYYGISVVKKLKNEKIKPAPYNSHNNLASSVSKVLQRNNLKELFAGLEKNGQPNKIGYENLLKMSIEGGMMTHQEIAKLTEVSKKIEKLKELLEKRLEEE